MAELIQESDLIKVLDLSWNNFQDKKYTPLFGTKWKKALEENKSLLHLDLSFNKISLEDTKLISEGIHFNNTLFGYHYAGNCGIVDSLGFLATTTDYMIPNLGNQHFKRRIQSTLPLM